MQAEPSPVELELRQVRILGAAMLGVGALYRSLPTQPVLSCPLRALTGIPCPFCGMTRSVVSALHGDVVQSLRFNPVGMLLILAIVAAFVAYRSTRLRVTPWLIPAIVAAMWVWNLTLNPTFH